MKINKNFGGNNSKREEKSSAMKLERM